MYVVLYVCKYNILLVYPIYVVYTYVIQCTQLYGVRIMYVCMYAHDLRTFLYAYVHVCTYILNMCCIDTRT